MATDYDKLLAQYLSAREQSNPNGIPELDDPYRGYNLADGSGVQMHNGSLDYTPRGAKAGDQYTTYGQDGSVTNGTIKDGHSFLDPLFDALPMAVPALIAGGTLASAGAFGDPSTLFGGAGATDGAGAAINPAMHFSDAAFDAGMPGAASGAQELVTAVAPHFSDAAFDAAQAGTDSALSMPEYANESAKLLQQQALADSGVDLLPTNLPTVDLSDPFPYKDVLKQVAKSLVGSGGGGGGSAGGFNGSLPAVHSSGAVGGGLSQAQSMSQPAQQVNSTQLAQFGQPTFNFNDYQKLSPGVAKHDITPLPEQNGSLAKIAQMLKGGSWQT